MKKKLYHIKTFSTFTKRTDHNSEIEMLGVHSLLLLTHSQIMPELTLNSFRKFATSQLQRVLLLFCNGTLLTLE